MVNEIKDEYTGKFTNYLMAILLLVSIAVNKIIEGRE